MIDDLTQEPQPQDPQQMKQRLQSLVKLRADQLQETVFNDKQEVVHAGETDPKRALQRAQDHFAKFVEMDPDSAREVRDYILGRRQELPLGWALDNSQRPSRESILDAGAVQQAEQFRAEHPVRAALVDIGTPVENLAIGAPQLLADAGFGIANLIGARVSSPDLRAMARVGIRGLMGQTHATPAGVARAVEETAAEARVWRETAGPAAGAMSDVGDIGGMLRGFMTQGLAGFPVKAAMKPGEVAGSIATKLPREALKLGGMEKTAEFVGAVGRGAGGFATFEMLSEFGRNPDLKGEEALEAGKHGLIAGAAMGAAGEIARHAMRYLFSQPASKVALAGEGGEVMKSMRQWAEKNNIVPAPNESIKSFGYRAIDAWIAGGMEGAPAMPVRKLIGWAARGGIESTGLSVLSAQFQEKVLQPIFDQDPNSQPNWKVAIEEFGKSALGMAVARARLEDIPALQRRAGTKSKPAEAEPQQPEQEPQAAPARTQDYQPQPAAGGGLGEAGVSKMEGEPDAHYRTDRNRATGTVMETQPAPLQEFGWREVLPEKPPEGGAEVKLDEPLAPREGGVATGPGKLVELPGTSYSFTVDGGVARPSASLRAEFKLPEEMPEAEFADLMTKAGLYSSMDALRLLPGTQISAHPTIVAESGVGGKDGIMRQIAMGEVLEAPLGPNPEWRPAKLFRARGSDVIPPEQQDVVDVLTHIQNERRDLPQDVKITLGKAIDVLKDVSADRSQAVAETMAALPEILPGIAGAEPKVAAEAVRVLAESLTTKAPEVAINDLMAGQVTKAAPAAGREGEAGFIDVSGAGEAVDRAVKGLLRFPVRALGTVLSLPLEIPGVRTFTRGISSKLSDIKDPPTRERAQTTFNQIEANTREFVTEWEPMAADLPRYRTSDVRQLEKLRWQDRTEEGNQAGYSLYHILKESVLRDRFGIDMEGLPPSVKRIVGIGSKITRAIRAAAADLKMHVQGRYTPEGHLAEIARTTAKDVLTRQPTLELSDAMMAREGKTYEAVVDVLAKDNGMTREDVEAIFAEEGFTDARGLKRRDPIEHVRRFKYFPDHVRRSDGVVVRLLETNPLRHAKRMIAGAAARLGTVKELGPDDIKPREGETPEQAAARGADTPYRDFVESFPEQHRDLIAMALRASMGMPTATLPKDVVGREGWHKFGKLVAAANDVRAALGMTASSWMQTIPEAFATTAAAFGANRVGRAYQYFAEAAKDNRLLTEIKARQEAGGFAMNLHEFFAGGEASNFEQVMSVARTMQNGALSLMDAAQTYVVDLAVHKALHDAVSDWRAGSRQQGDVDGLMTVFDLSRAHAEQVVSGKAPPQAYRQLELNGLARLTGRGELPINKSDFARSRSGLARLIKYTGYFQKRINQLRNATVAMREAETPKAQAAAAANFGKLLGFNMASYMAGQSVVAAFKGLEEFLGLWSETIEEAQDPLGAAKLVGTALLGSMFGGAGSFVVGGLRALFSGETESKAEAVDAATRAIPLLGTLGNAWDFGEAILANATGEPLGGDNPHSGKTPLQQIGYFAGTQVPLFRWAMNGPFGLGLTYLGTDPELEGALRASRRIDEKLGVELTFPENDDLLFVDTMRAAVNKLKGKEVDIGEIVSAIRTAVPGKDDTAVSASLLARRVLSGERWEKLGEEQQQSKLRSLGDAREELLRGYDAMLERTASFFRPRRR